jgi:glycosyltransferase involved in cell wall biosynthesis
MPVQSATILICTHRRAALLAETLCAINQLQKPPDCDVEVIVVDNRSNDDTPDIVARAAEAPGAPRIRYAFESSLGKSFALNHGLSLATGDIVALIDDDVLPSAGWLRGIVSHFRSDHELQFVFGKVLPRWETPPPAEFTDPRIHASWGPLALLDFGDALERYVDDGAPRRFPIGCNVAFRRETLLTVGGWRVDLGKVNNSLICGEDHEIFFRLKQHRLFVGMYDPAVSVQHFVPVARLSRRYFRRWFYWRGKTLARRMDDVYRPLDLTQCVRIAGVPRFLIRQFVEQLGALVRQTVSGDRVDRLIEQIQTAQYLGMFYELFRLWVTGFTAPAVVRLRSRESWRAAARQVFEPPYTTSRFHDSNRPLTGRTHGE